MAITSNSSTILNSYTPPFKLKGGELLKNDILVYDEVCKAFVNVAPAMLMSLFNAGTSRVVESIQLHTEVTDGLTVGFVIPWAAVSKDSLIVTFDGIKQLPTAYKLDVYQDTSLITFVDVVPIGVQIEVHGFQLLAPRKTIVKTYTIGAATDTIILPWVVNTERSALIFIDTVKQQQGSYDFTYSSSTSTTVTFSEVLPTGTTVDVVSLYGFDPAMFKFATLTGDNVTSTIELDWYVDSAAALFVSIDGVKQQEGSFTFANTSPASATLTFSEAIPLGSEVEVTGFTSLSAGSASPMPLIVGNNLGLGHAVFNSLTTVGGLTTLNFRTIAAGTGIEIVSTPTLLTISSTVAGQSFANVGTGVPLLKTPIATDIEVKSLRAGDGISLVDNGDDVEVSINIGDLDLSFPGVAASIVSVGTGVDIIKKASAAPDGQFELYSLKAGNGIVITRVGDQVVIADANGGNYVGVTSNYTVELDDAIVGIRDTSVQRFVTLTSVSLAGPGKSVVIKDETGEAASNNIVIAAPAGSTIDGVASVVITQNYGSAKFYCDGLNWFAI